MSERVSLGTDEIENEIENSVGNGEIEVEGDGWRKKAIQFVTSQTVSQFGSSLVRYAILWYITLQTGSGIMMTIATLCSFLPQFVISFFAGSWADKFNRKIIVIISDLFTAFCSLTLAVIMFFELDSLTIMFVVSALGSLGAGIQTPSANAILPQITPKSKLLSVNGIISGIQPLISIISPLVAALILATAGLYVVFVIDVSTALIAAGILVFLKLGKEEKQHNQSGSMKEGFAYMRKQGYIVPMIIFAGIFMFMITPAAMLTPLHVTRVFGDGYWYLMGLEIGFGVGMIAGGMLTATVLKKRNKSRMTALATFSLGAMTVILAFMTFNFYAYCAALFVLGMFVPIFNVPVTTLLQENVDPSMMGRIFAFFTIINSCMFPMGMLLFGPLADIVDIKYLLIATGIAQCALVIFALKGSWNRLRQAPPTGNS